MLMCGPAVQLAAHRAQCRRLEKELEALEEARREETQLMQHSVAQCVPVCAMLFVSLKYTY